MLYGGIGVESLFSVCVRYLNSSSGFKVLPLLLLFVNAVNNVPQFGRHQPFENTGLGEFLVVTSDSSLFCVNLPVCVYMCMWGSCGCLDLGENQMSPQK